MSLAARDNWTVPTEMAIALAPPSIEARIRRLRALGDSVLPDASVYSQDGKLLAAVGYISRGRRTDLQFQIMAALWENRPHVAAPKASLP